MGYRMDGWYCQIWCGGDKYYGMCDRDIPMGTGMWAFGTYPNYAKVWCEDMV